MRFSLDELSQAASLPALDVFEGSSILITGASGLIGSAFAELLMARKIAGGTIDIVLSGRSEPELCRRFADTSALWSFEPHDATLPWRGSRRFDFILHAAAPAHPVAISAHPAETLCAIVRGTSDVLSHAVASHAKRILYVSSSEIYGTAHGKQTLWHEDEQGEVPILSSRSCYPQGKRAAETLCAATCVQQGLDVVIVRPGHVYGPTITSSDSRAHAQFARAAAGGRPIVMKSRGEQLRSYCYSLDAATAFATLFANGVSGQAYNLSNPHSIVTVRQMAEAFALAGDVPVQFECPSEKELAGYNPMPMSALCGDRLLSLGWNPAYTMADGARKTVDDLRLASL